MNPGGLVAASYYPEMLGPFTHYAPAHGPLFWVYVLGNYGILLLAFTLVFLAYRRSYGAKRAQARLVFIGAAIPFVISAVNQLNPRPLEGVEAAAFFVTGIVFLVAMTRGALPDLSGHLVAAKDASDGERDKAMLDAANEYLAEELEAAHVAARALYEQATHDPLTCLHNRRAMSEHLMRETARATRTGEPIALLLLDIDQLKQINDSMSHAAGDEALIGTSKILLARSRSMDMSCRLGGDEFLVIMLGADVDTAVQRAEQLRREIHRLTVSMGSRTMPVSVSIGVATAPKHGTTASELLAAADRALIAAKHEGRNRTEVAAV